MRFSFLVLVGLLLSQPVFAERPYPKREDYKLEKDSRVSDEALRQDATEMKVEACSGGLEEGRGSCLDYSTIVKRPYAELKEILLNIPNYKNSMKNALVKESLDVPCEGATEQKRTIYIVFGFLNLEIAYYMDALIQFPKKLGSAFGYRYRQTDEYCGWAEPRESIMMHHNGAWHVEKFGTQPDDYYVRLQSAVHFDVDQEDTPDNNNRAGMYRNVVKLNTRLIFNVLRNKN